MNTYTDSEWQESLIFEWETLFNWVLIAGKYAQSIIGILESEIEEQKSIAEIENEVWLY